MPTIESNQPPADRRSARSHGRVPIPAEAQSSSDDDLRARRLGLLHDVSRQLTSILDRQQLLERVADEVKRLIDYQLFGVMLWDAESGQLETAVSVRRDGCGTPRRQLALGEGLCGTAAELRSPVRVADVTADPRFVNWCDPRVRSELVVPMLIEDRLIGVVDLESYQLDAFSDEDEQLVATLAAYLAVALDNAQLYERVQADERRLARELAAAREMQRMLLPNRSPWLPGLQTAVAYCPARQLGGDLYDFLTCGEGRTAILVGDVAGKGTGAALYGSLAIGLLRGSVANTTERSPACAVAHLNEELHQLRAERRFLALGYALYDHPASRLTLINAGLPFPWLLRDGKAQEIHATGLPLGAMAGARHQEHSLELQPGDVVVLATDGLEESLDPAGRPLGADGVRRALEALAGRGVREIADGLLEAGDRHLAGAEPGDDRTILALRVGARS